MSKAKGTLEPTPAKKAFKLNTTVAMERRAPVEADDESEDETSVLQGLLDDVSSKLGILSNRQEVLRKRLQPVSRNYGIGVSESDDPPEDECSFQTQLVALRDMAQVAIERTNDAITNLMI